MDPWPFDQPRNAATITVWPILRRIEPITFVSHDASDHGWQFLNIGNDKAVNMADASVVGLEEIVDLDPSVLELADLPPGWCAWRSDAASPWNRSARHR